MTDLSSVAVQVQEEPRRVCWASNEGNGQGMEGQVKKTLEPAWSALYSQGWQFYLKICDSSRL